MDSVPRWRVGDPAPPPLPRRSEADVVARWQDGPPLVSVLCATYQHVDFIEDALRGFLGQDTDFPFEVIVRDDGSTDGTAEIVREYADRYPTVIRAILEPVNTYPATKPLARLLREPLAEFVALCEGDDYWIDKNKISLQVRRIQNHPEIALVHHQAITISSGRIESVARLPTDWSRNLTAKQLREGAWCLTNTLLFRRFDYAPLREEVRVTNGDLILVSRLGRLGGAEWADEVLPSVYRRHEGGIWSPLRRGVALRQQVESHIWVAVNNFEVGDVATGTAHVDRVLRWVDDLISQATESKIRRVWRVWVLRAKRLGYRLLNGARRN